MDDQNILSLAGGKMMERDAVVDDPLITLCSAISESRSLAGLANMIEGSLHHSLESSDSTQTADYGGAGSPQPFAFHEPPPEQQRIVRDAGSIKPPARGESSANPGRNERLAGTR